MTMKQVMVTAAVDFDKLAATIENDPKAWARKANVNLLARVIGRASEIYYNSGDLWLTDATFDILLDILREKDPKHPQLKKVGAVDPKAKAKLPYYLPSLDKVKTGVAVDAWKASNKAKQYIVSDKIDGVSLLIVYDGTGGFRLFTRGDGRVGREITHIGQYLKIPRIKKQVAIRGEIVMPRAKFNTFLKQSDKPDNFNLRNFMSGLVNRTNAKSPELAHAHFVAYEVVNPLMQPSKQFAHLKAAGFTVAAYKVVESDVLTVDFLSKALERRKTSSKYDADGLVVTADVKYSRTVSGVPDYSIAFKQTLDSDTINVVVKSVTWQISRHKTLIPVVEIEGLA